MENYIMLDGKKIAISEETARNMRKEFKKEWDKSDISTPLQVRYGGTDWTAFADGRGYYLLREDCTTNQWPKNMGLSTVSPNALVEHLNKVGAVKK